MKNKPNRRRRVVRVYDARHSAMLKGLNIEEIVKGLETAGFELGKVTKLFRKYQRAKDRYEKEA